MTSDAMDTTNQHDLGNLYEDDDEDEYTVTPVANTSRSRRITAGLFVLLFIGAAFWGGAYVQKHWGSNSTSGSNIASQFAAARGRAGTAGGTTGGTGAGGFGGAAGGAGATTGSVTLVDGNNIYVTETSGNVVKIVTGPSSTFSKTDSGAISDVKPGQTVTVRGSTDSDGNVDATSVSLGN